MKKNLNTAEAVTEGHPDKLCDQISDAILDACIKQDPNARVAVETLISKNLAVVAGEMTFNGNVDPVAVARRVITGIGYDSPQSGIDGERCLIVTNLNEQSADIARSISKNDTDDIVGWTAGCKRCAWTPPKPGTETLQHKRHLGAGDQGFMVGYAVDETPEFMPLSYMLATRLAKRLAQVRRDGTLPWLRPDGKTQVTIRTGEDGRPEALTSVILSAQHNEQIALQDLQQALMREVVDNIIDPKWITVDSRIKINPSGRFVIGGPLGDTGVTGRKLMVDTYGSAARHGGGAFSGKDPSKVDRSGAYMARYVAKNIVALGLARRCEVTLAYAIGQEEPEMISLDTFGTATRTEEAILKIVKDECSFAVEDIIEGLQLQQPIYENTAAYGHFGREAFPWEKVDGFKSVKKYR